MISSCPFGATTAPARPYSALVPTVAALLAAGGGTRFKGDRHKLLAVLRGRPVWQHSLEAVLGAGFDHVVLVTGAAELAVEHLPSQVTVVHNPSWKEGQSTSLQAAVAAARSVGADALTVGLADQPFIPTETWQAVRDADRDCPVVVAVYDGKLGPNPVRLGRAVWSLLPTAGDVGAREVIRAHPSWVCRVECLGSGADIDTLEDLGRWKSC